MNPVILEAPPIRAPSPPTTFQTGAPSPPAVVVGHEYVSPGPANVIRSISPRRSPVPVVEDTRGPSPFPPLSPINSPIRAGIPFHDGILSRVNVLVMGYAALDTKDFLRCVSLLGRVEFC